MTVTGTFSAAVSGLSPNTLYHFRAKAEGDGTVDGSDVSFTTAAAPTTPPTVATDAATSATANSATLNGNLTGMGTAGSVDVSFEYGETTSYGSTTEVQAKTVTGTFSAAVSGLNAVPALPR